MKKILIIHFSLLANEEHYQYVVVFRTLVDGSEAVKVLLAADLPVLDLLLAQERTAIDAPHGSFVTAKIKAADKTLDKRLGLTFSAVDAAKFSPNPAVAQAAEEILFALKPYRGIQGKKHEAEVGATKSLLEDLKGKYLAQSTTVGIVPWLDQVQEAVNIEEALFAQRNTENAQRAQQDTVKAIRSKVEELVHHMVKHVEVAATAENSDAYDTFIAELNAKIRYENLRHQPRKMDIGEAIVMEISAQPFAGKAVIPIPTLRYTNSKGDTLELTFAKDFTVKYKDNDRVGNASLTIIGKGKYSGRKVVAFNVV